MELNGARPTLEDAQRLYARWLEAGTRVGLGVLVAGFAVYALGLLPPQVPVADLPRLWTLSAAQFQAAAGVAPGWGWLGFVQRGDYLNYVGVVVLVTITAVCYLRVLPLLAPRERAYFWIALLEIAVLAAAASGVLSGGH
jgi:uncharacterized membrane protein YiaA